MKSMKLIISNTFGIFRRMINCTVTSYTLLTFWIIIKYIIYLISQSNSMNAILAKLLLLMNVKRNYNVTFNQLEIYNLY